MSFATNLRCRECHREYPLTANHVCEYCFGPVEVTYDYDAIRNNTSRESISRGPASLWRYADFLPVERDAAIDIGAGFTPLVRQKTSAKPSASTTSTSRTTPSIPPGRSRTASLPSPRHAPANLASQPLPAPAPGTSPTASVPTPRRPVWKLSSSSPTTSNPPKSSAPASMPPPSSKSAETTTP